MSFTLNKTQITAGSTGNVITVTGSAGPFSVASGPGTITAQTTGQFTITGGAAYGLITISDGSTTALLSNAPAGTKAISYDNFNRANTTPGGTLGNGWIDNNNYWEIQSNTAAPTGGPYDYSTARVMRPESEQFINGSVRMHYKNQSGQTQLLARISETTDNVGDAIAATMIPGYGILAGYWSGGAFTSNTGYANPTFPSEGWLELVFNGANVTVNLYQADGVTPVANGTVSITVPAPLGAGSVGMCQSYSGSGIQIAEIDAFQTLAISATPIIFKEGVSTTLAITGQGTNFSGSSISATNATISTQSASSATSASVTLTAINPGPVVLTDSGTGASFTVNDIDPLTVVYDIFNRANTSVGSGANSTNMGAPTYYYSPSADGAWIDFTGNLWSINTNLALSGGTANILNAAAALYRPSAENMVNGKSQVGFLLGNNLGNFPSVGAVARFTPASGGSGYSAKFYGVNQNGLNCPVVFTTLINGTETQIAEIHPNQLTVPAYAIFELAVQQKNSTTTTLTANVYPQSAPPPFNAPLWSYSIDDTTSALQNVSGSYGALASGQALVDGINFMATVAAPTALTIGNPVASEIYKTNAYVGVSGIQGGTPPYTVQWYRSTTSGFTPGAGNLVSGATSAYYHDSGLTAGTTYYWKCKVTDSLGATVTSSQLSATMLSANAIIVGNLGDSITVGYYLQYNATNACHTLSNYLISQGIQSVFINCGAGGSSSGDWAAGNAGLTAAITNWSNRDLSCVNYMIGTNDASNSISQSQYSSNVAGTSAEINAQGWPIFLCYSPWNSQGSAQQTLLLQYETAINALVNGTTILQGDTTAYAQFEANPSWLVDGVHPNATGDAYLGPAWAMPIKAFFGTPATSYTLTGPSSGTVGIASSNFTVTPNGSFTGTITPNDGGNGGTFTPSSLTFSSSSAAQTFTYTAASTGVKSIGATNSGSLTNPSAISYTANPNTAATAYTLTGPSSGTAGVASTNFTVTPNGNFTGTITPNDSSGSGTFTPSSLTFSGSSAAQTFTYTAATIGNKTIAATNSGTLTNPSSLPYTAISALVAPTVAIAPYASGVAVSWTTSDTGVTFNINHNGTVTTGVTSPYDYVIANLGTSNVFQVQSVNATGAGPFGTATLGGGGGGGGNTSNGHLVIF